MKTKVLITSLMAFILLFSADAFGQRGRRAPDVRPQQRFSERQMEQSGERRQYADVCQMIPDLTEEQEEQIRSLRLDQLERNTEHRNAMDELRARRRSLMTESDPDMSAVNNVIDEMTALRNAQMKENVNHHLAVRELLTEEQRVIFDSRTGQMNRGRAHSARAGGRTGGRAHQAGGGRW
ncbi:MAG: Spy/CpxP family protein refolding chaperone [Bacteroidales bacterium]